VLPDFKKPTSQKIQKVSQKLPQLAKTCSQKQPTVTKNI